MSKCDNCPEIATIVSLTREEGIVCLLGCAGPDEDCPMVELDDGTVVEEEEPDEL